MSRILPALLAATVTLSLAACDKNDSKDNSASLSIEMNSQADAGNVAISIPGFDAKLKVPSGIMGHGDFDIDGVKLYPKAKVLTFNVTIDKASTSAQPAASPIVRMSFAAPADVPTVTAWYKAQFAAKSVSATETPTGLAGKTQDGDSFTITLTPGAPGETTGAIALTDIGK